MKIIKANLNDINEVKNMIDVIYQVFCECNAIYASETYKAKMKSLYGDGYDYEYTLNVFKKSPLFFVAKEQDTIVGIIRGTPEKLSNLYVLKQQQGKGLGKQLLEKFEKEAKQLGSTVIRLKSSKYALPFYLKNGYTIEQENRLIKYL